MSGKMKNMAGMWGMMSAMAHQGNEMYMEEVGYKKLSKEDKEELRKIYQEKKLERLKKRGVKEFHYGDNVVLARNKKNADRKAKNKGYL